MLKLHLTETIRPGGSQRDGLRELIKIQRLCQHNQSNVINFCDVVPTRVCNSVSYMSDLLISAQVVQVMGPTHCSESTTSPCCYSLQAIGGCEQDERMDDGGATDVNVSMFSFPPLQGNNVRVLTRIRMVSIEDSHD